MVRNGDIRGFFGNKPQSSSATSRQEATTAADAMMMDIPPSSPSTPPRASSSKPVAAAAALPRFGLQDEIKGSDEDDDSDGSLASLSAIIGGRSHNAVSSTPQVKRVASSSNAIGGRSPLTLQQKQRQQQQQQQRQTHKFDMKALISHTRQSEKEEETSRQAEELIKKAEDSSSSTGGSSEDDDDDAGDSSDNVDMATTPSKRVKWKKKKKSKKPKKGLEQVAKELLDDGGNNGGASGGDEDESHPKGDKIARAIHRAQGQGAGSNGRQRRCYFFDVNLPPLFQPAKTPFPEDAAEEGPWSFLANPQTRDQAIIHGLPHTIVARGHRELPPELFLWVLDQVCVERDPRLRAQFCSLAAACRTRTRELVDGARLYGALGRVGGPEYVRAEPGRSVKLKATPEVEEPYRGRNWSGLAAFLDLLRLMAPNLNTGGGGGVIVEAVQLLLRMSLDPVVVAAVRREHLAALAALMAVLPGGGGAEATRRGALSWNNACFSICSYVLKCTDDTVQRLDPIISIPKSSAKLADLRRRLAATILFDDDEAFGRHPTDSALEAEGVEAVLARLERPDFTIRPDTDYEELRALVGLLDIVVESGGFLRRRRRKHGDNSAVAGGEKGGPEEERDADRQFDIDVDRLTFRLKVLHDKIHDNGVLSRKEAKTAVDVVSKRLTYAVRTRPPVKTSIFDLQPVDKEEANLPKQRDFMKNWAQRRAAASANGAERRSPAAVA